MVAEILQAQGRLASALVRAGDSACGAGEQQQLAGQDFIMCLCSQGLDPLAQ